MNTMRRTALLGRTGCNLFDWSDCHYQEALADIGIGAGTGATTGGWFGAAIGAIVGTGKSLLRNLTGGGTAPAPYPGAVAPANYAVPLAIAVTGGALIYIAMKKKRRK